MPVAFAAYYDSGRSGESWEDAYVISSASDLIALKNRVNNGTEPSGKYYMLTSDIDLTSQTGWEGIRGGSGFRGHFDGQNHTIRINSQTNNLLAGLFHTVYVSFGDIAIRNLNVTGDVKANCAGTLVHYLYDGIVENCSFTGTIIPNNSNSSWGAGGIVGHMLGGTVRNCRINATIAGASYAGGIAGGVGAGNIENCTVSDNTTISARQVGGIAGYVSSGFNGRLSGNTWPSQYPETGNDYTPSPDTPSTDDTPTAGASTEWNGHRYQLYTGNTTWDNAKSRCESLGGHLATITSQQEQLIVASLLSGNNSYWLGAKRGDYGLWQWVTDEVFERQYANFKSGQPDGSGNRLAISSSGWDDLHSAENASGFICEWDNEPETVRAAPLSSLFQSWQNNPEAWADSEVIPSPIDYSHLANNPPRVSASGVRASALESRYDGRTAIGLPAARSQNYKHGTSNTCWAFASIAALEASCLKQGISAVSSTPDFSELQVVWNVNSQDSTGSVIALRGYADKAERFLRNSPVAPVNEDEFPYTVATDVQDENAVDNAIRGWLNGRTLRKAPVTLTDMRTLAGTITPNDVNLVKQNIKDHGGVYVHYLHDNAGFDEEHASYYFNQAIEDLKKLHAVLLVGWYDDYPVSNFKNPPSIPGAWLARNSWGTSWADNGYFWLSYEYNNNQGLTNAKIFTASADRLPEKIVSEHDEHGVTHHIVPKWSSSIFSSDVDANLVQIAFYVTDNNAQYQVFVNNFGHIKPTDPGDAENPLLAGEFPNAGWHTLTLPSPIALYAGDYYSVIVKITPTSDYAYASGVEADVFRYASVQVNEGTSFFATGEPVPSVWQDGKFITGGPYNACIQAITVPRVSLETAPKITTTSLPDAQAGQNYSNVTLAASGIGMLEWRCGNIPEGMALSTSGVLSGRPVRGGTYDLKIMVFNATGQDEVTLRLTVRGGSSDTPVSRDNEAQSSKDDDDWICNSGFGIVSLLAAVSLFWRKCGQ